MEGDSVVILSIINELHSAYIQEFKWQVKVVIFEVSLMNFILRIFNEIKGTVKVV